MCDNDQPPDVVTEEIGLNLVDRERYKQLLESVAKKSPVRIFGKDLLQSAAADLQERKRTGKPISASRVAYRLRPICRNWSDVLLATVKTHPEYEGGHFAKACPSQIRLPASTERKNRGEEKLEQADRALHKAINLLRSDDVKAFETFDEAAAVPFRKEIERIRKLIGVPEGRKRGLPVVAVCIEDIYALFRDLTGRSLRGPRDARKQDEFISNLLFDFVRPITPGSIHDENIRSAIETTIKSKIQTISKL